MGDWWFRGYTFKLQSTEMSMAIKLLATASANGFFESEKES